MQIKLYRSSTVGIISGNFKLLADPWLTDGIYFGSWSHYPYYDLKSNLDEINSYNAIYISHIHQDHCDDNTLKLIRKDIPIYIHKFHSKALKFKLQNLGFKVHELENGKKFKLSETLNINIYAADNCNPDLCYKLWGCADLNVKDASQQVDTLALFDNNKEVILNLNDCPYDLAKSTFASIKKEYEKIDLLLTGYGGAGPYPQCFDNLNIKEKNREGEKKRNSFLNYAIKYIEEFKPDYYLPYAGTYTLTGKLSNLQNLRGVPTTDEAFSFLENYIDNDYLLRKKVKPAKINNDQLFDISLGESSQSYKKINVDEYQDYIDRVLSKRNLDYENDPFPSFDEIYDLCKKAHIRFVDKKLINSVKLQTEIYLKVQERLIKISKNDSNLEVIKNIEGYNFDKKYIIYDLDMRLLKKLLMGPRFAHWSEAEGGSHVRYFRKPNIMESASVMSMCNFYI